MHNATCKKQTDMQKHATHTTQGHGNLLTIVEISSKKSTKMVVFNKIKASFMLNMMKWSVLCQFLGGNLILIGYVCLNS